MSARVSGAEQAEQTTVAVVSWPQVRWVNSTGGPAVAVQRSPEATSASRAGTKSVALVVGRYSNRCGCPGYR
jgi:hypothetical protein